MRQCHHPSVRQSSHAVEILNRQVKESHDKAPDRQTMCDDDRRLYLLPDSLPHQTLQKC
jgi:hypothetical protein